MWKRSNQYTRGPWAWTFCLRTHLAIEQVPGRYCTYTFSTPGGSKLSLFSLYQQWFRKCRSILKIAIFGHEIWPLAKVSKVAHIFSFYPIGSKSSLFSLYGQWLLRYWPIFKITIFGRETWPLAKVSQVAHILPKLPPSAKFHPIVVYSRPFPIY